MLTKAYLAAFLGTLEFDAMGAQVDTGLVCGYTRTLFKARLSGFKEPNVPSFWLVLAIKTRLWLNS